MQPITNLLKKLVHSLEGQQLTQSHFTKHHARYKKRSTSLFTLIKHLPASLLLQWNKELNARHRTQRSNEQQSINLILENTTDAFFTINNTYTVTYWNQQAERLLGINRTDIMGKNLWEVFPKVPKFHTEYERAIKENTPVRFEAYYQPLDRWFDVSAYPLDEGLGIYFRDITDAKKNYQDLVRTETDVRNFARQLNSMLEEERSRIAREIHDEFGQQLAAIKMSVALTKHYIEVQGKEEVKQRLDDISHAIDNTMDSLRSFATELRPGILDTMGLIPSLEWLAKEFEKKTGINCYIDADTNEQDLEKSFATGYFRICQEALTNVLKHAQAKNVAIQVYQEKDELTLNIIDDGIGIVEENIQNPFSMGILGMKERANLIGGTLSIQKAAQGGTIVQLKAKIHAH